ncbi:flagellin N-terminal helical domain-containing protein [Sphingobium sp. YR768]|uniref:flagellin N-terminal helical domain-containing protein n=1 Tax=Sphingobium sp. YR768 TaxID=1884365 RepID=UPI0008D34782|nr:flagellin [Sphingobium sp. YR768]SEQ69170.1 flagellin [Sphingobium sp. YR768]
MTVVGTNSIALRVSNSSTAASMMLNNAMERLSTGKRINSAKDDAAGMGIAMMMTAQVRGITQGIRNASDGLSLAQTADGALAEMSNMLQRMRELTVQALNGTNDNDARSAIKTEMDQLATQITDEFTNSEFNGTKLFDGSSTSVHIQAGANASNGLSIDLTDLSTDATLAAVVNGTVATVDVTDPAFSAADLVKFDDAINSISAARGTFGAMQNRLESVITNLSTEMLSLTDSRSRIEDADFSHETTQLAKAQILSQASTAMLAQANQSQQGILKLLG